MTLLAPTDPALPTIDTLVQAKYIYFAQYGELPGAWKMHPSTAAAMERDPYYHHPQRVKDQLFIFGAPVLERESVAEFAIVPCRLDGNQPPNAYVAQQPA